MHKPLPYQDGSSETVYFLYFIIGFYQDYDLSTLIANYPTANAFSQISRLICGELQD